MLTDTTARQAKPRDKAYRLPDSGGLYLWVTPSGGKIWRAKYRLDGREQTAVFGPYPQLSLKGAREKLSHLKELLATGMDPRKAKHTARERQSIEQANTFGEIARDWLAAKAPGWSASYGETVSLRLGKNILPFLEARPIKDITAPEMLAVLRKAEERGAQETAAKMRAVCGQIFRYAIALGHAERDICADLIGTISRPRSKHYAAFTNPLDVGGLLRMIDSYQGGLIVRAALKLHPMLFCRPGELRAMRWAEIDLERAEWRYRVSKSNLDHVVPLARQAVAVLREIQPFSGGGGYVFPGRGGKRPISEMTLSTAFQRMGIDTKTEATPHGWRATARTLLAERLKFEPRIIELQLAHSVPDSLGRAYNRALFLDERVHMMQAWADYLDTVAENR